jgi:hypothetical protein
MQPEYFLLGGMPLPSAPGEWSCTTPITTVFGLEHLEGETVSILADGNVEPPQEVVDGTIILQHPATKITIGLAYPADLQTLPMDAGEPTIQGKRKKISAVNIKVFESRGLKVGPFEADLTEIKERTDQPYGKPIPFKTEEEWVIIGPSWSKTGQVFIRQDYPLYATVLAVTSEISIGDN